MSRLVTVHCGKSRRQFYVSLSLPLPGESFPQRANANLQWHEGDTVSSIFNDRIAAWLRTNSPRGDSPFLDCQLGPNEVASSSIISLLPQRSVFVVTVYIIPEAIYRYNYSIKISLPSISVSTPPKHILYQRALCFF